MGFRSTHGVSADLSPAIAAAKIERGGDDLVIDGRSLDDLTHVHTASIELAAGEMSSNAEKSS